MVTRAYLLDKPAAPSSAKVFFDQQVIPLAINAAGAFEVRIEGVARGARRAPLRALASAFSLGCVLASLIHRRGT